MSRFKRDRLLSRATAPIKSVSRATGAKVDEISCLSTLGFSDLVLDQTRWRAQALNVSPFQLLMAEGQINETDFYRHYAIHLGAHFLAEIPAFARECDWRHALRSGHARLQDGRWLFAPQGRALTLLTDRLIGSHRHKFLLTSPSLMRKALSAQFAKKIAKQATHDLANTHANASAKTGISTGQKRTLAASLAMVCFGIVDGGVLWALCCALFSGAIAFGVVMRLAGILRALDKPNPTAPPLPDGLLPTYTLLVPLYREEVVLAQLVESLSALDYPSAKCEILLLIEQDDAQTRAVLDTIHLPSHAHVVLVPPGHPRTKPRALNVGLLYARGDCLVVYDAEDRPERDQLRRAAAAFAQGGSRLACLQASLAIDNARETWLTRLFAVDYANHFDVLHQGHSNLGLPLPLGGTSNHFRTQALRDIGGWDAWNVTEDADLGLRLARFGYASRMLASTTWEEAPINLSTWLPQRRRWMKGWMQTFLTHTHHPLALVQEVGILRAAHILALLIANTFGPLVGTWLTIYVLWHAWLGDLLSASVSWSGFAVDLCWAILATVGFVSMLVPTLMGIHRRHLWSSLPWLALRGVYWLCMSVAGVQALIEISHNPFHWSKTPHGVSKDRGPARP